METNTNFIPRPLVWLLGIFLVILVGMLVVQHGYDLSQTFGHKNPKNTLPVTAEGKVSAVPDLATIDLGVLTQGTTVAEVQKQSTDKINKIIAFVMKQGVDKKDVVTSQFNIYPQQDYTSGKPTITGYQANQSITVKVRNIAESADKVGKILAGATDAGANQVNGVSLSFDNPDALREQAREMAITKAKQQAESLAKAAGLTLGRVVTVSDASSYSPGPIPYASDTKAIGFGGGGSLPTPPDIQAGSQDITASMTVVFEIK